MNPTSQHLQHDEQRNNRRQRRVLIIRNWLNGIFIVLSLLSIIGVLLKLVNSDFWLVMELLS